MMGPSDWERSCAEAVGRLVRLEQDNARLRALIRDAEQDGVGLLCPWCQFARRHGEHGHKPDCLAFTPTGEVR